VCACRAELHCKAQQSAQNTEWKSWSLRSNDPNSYPEWCTHPQTQREEQHPCQLWCQGWFPSALAVLQRVFHHLPSGTGSHGTGSLQRCAPRPLCPMWRAAATEQHTAYQPTYKFQACHCKPHVSAYWMIYQWEMYPLHGRINIILTAWCTASFIRSFFLHVSH